jgi:hypothetical protein
MRPCLRSLLFFADDRVTPKLIGQPSYLFPGEHTCLVPLAAKGSNTLSHEQGCLMTILASGPARHRPKVATEDRDELGSRIAHLHLDRPTMLVGSPKRIPRAARLKRPEFAEWTIRRTPPPAIAPHVAHLFRPRPGRKGAA